MARFKAERATKWLERTVTFLQTIVAAALVILLLLGVVSLALTIFTAVTSRSLTRGEGVLAVIRSSIDIVLYIFVVVELYKTIVAYVESKSVVMAVIHAGLIAVVRQVITFKPDDYGPREAVMIAGVYVLLLAVLLLGFYVVHREIGEEVE